MQRSSSQCTMTATSCLIATAALRPHEARSPETLPLWQMPALYRHPFFLFPKGADYRVEMRWTRTKATSSQTSQNLMPCVHIVHKF